VVAILEGMNPRMLEIKLAGFLNRTLPPQQSRERERAA
jgi:flagellar motor component MotA